MPKINVEISVSKESYELAQGSVKVVKALKEALKDGFQPGQDVPAIVSAVIADLIPAVQGMDQVALESQEDEKAFVQAFVLSAVDMLYVFKK